MGEGYALEKVSIRLVKEAPIVGEYPVSSPMDAVRFIGEELCQMDREAVCVLNVNAAGIPINYSIVSIGALDHAIMHPREIFKSAILSNATSILLVHNHPTGVLTPSKFDTMVTDQMIKACEIMGIRLLDHIIVGGRNKEYFSFEQQGLMKFEAQDRETDYKKIEIRKHDEAAKSRASRKMK